MAAVGLFCQPHQRTCAASSDTAIEFDAQGRARVEMERIHPTITNNLNMQKGEQNPKPLTLPQQANGFSQRRVTWRLWDWRCQNYNSLSKANYLWLAGAACLCVSVSPPKVIICGCVSWNDCDSTSFWVRVCVCLFAQMEMKLARKLGK